MEKKTKAELIADARADAARLRELAEKAQAELDKRKESS
jgi:hypothetical protein